MNYGLLAEDAVSKGMEDAHLATMTAVNATEATKAAPENVEQDIQQRLKDSIIDKSDARSKEIEALMQQSSGELQGAIQDAQAEEQHHIAAAEQRLRQDASEAEDTAQHMDTAFTAKMGQKFETFNQNALGTFIAQSIRKQQRQSEGLLKEAAEASEKMYGRLRSASADAVREREDAEAAEQSLVSQEAHARSILTGGEDAIHKQAIRDNGEFTHFANAEVEMALKEIRETRNRQQTQSTADDREASADSKWHQALSLMEQIGNSAKLSEHEEEVESNIARHKMQRAFRDREQKDRSQYDAQLHQFEREGQNALSEAEGELRHIYTTKVADGKQRIKEVSALSHKAMQEFLHSQKDSRLIVEAMRSAGDVQKTKKNSLRSLVQLMDKLLQIKTDYQADDEEKIFVRLDKIFLHTLNLIDHRAADLLRDSQTHSHSPAVKVHRNFLRMFRYVDDF